MSSASVLLDAMLRVDLLICSAFMRCVYIMCYLFIFLCSPEVTLVFRVLVRVFFASLRSSSIFLFLHTKNTHRVASIPRSKILHILQCIAISRYLHAYVAIRNTPIIIKRRIDCRAHHCNADHRLLSVSAYFQRVVGIARGLNSR